MSNVDSPFEFVLRKEYVYVNAQMVTGSGNGLPISLACGHRSAYGRVSSAGVFAGDVPGPIARRAASKASGQTGVCSSFVWRELAERLPRGLGQGAGVKQLLCQRYQLRLGPGQHRRPHGHHRLATVVQGPRSPEYPGVSLESGLP